MQYIKDFLWGTFNYKDKGMSIWKYPIVGKSFVDMWFWLFSYFATFEIFAYES